MIPVRCHTNLDDVNREAWPTELPAVPSVGDLIVSGTEWKIEGSPRRVRLQVVRVSYEPEHDCLLTRRVIGWYTRVELHLPPNQFYSVAHFIDWYGYIRGMLSHDMYVKRSEENRQAAYSQRAEVEKMIDKLKGLDRYRLCEDEDVVSLLRTLNKGADL